MKQQSPICLRCSHRWHSHRWGSCDATDPRTDLECGCTEPEPVCIACRDLVTETDLHICCPEEL